MTILTGIFKEPVASRLAVAPLNIEGDGQADLTVHGGPDKAVYAYPSEHYGPWREQLGRELPPGMFGENLTTEGFSEDAVHIGDEFRVGTAQVSRHAAQVAVLQAGNSLRRPWHRQVVRASGKAGDLLRRAGRRRSRCRRPDRGPR